MYIVLNEFVFYFPFIVLLPFYIFVHLQYCPFLKESVFLFLPKNRDGVSSGLHPPELVCAHTTCKRSSHACADVGIIRFCDMFAEKIECEVFVDKWFIILTSVFQNIVNYIDNCLTSYYQLSKINIAFYPTYYL